MTRFEGFVIGSTTRPGRTHLARPDTSCCSSVPCRFRFRFRFRFRQFTGPGAMISGAAIESIEVGSRCGFRKRKWHGNGHRSRHERATATASSLPQSSVILGGMRKSPIIIALVVLAAALLAWLVVLGSRPQERATAGAPDTEELAGHRAADQDTGTPAPATTAGPSTSTEAHPCFLFGRITTHTGGTYEGRLRFGGDEEALWGNTFNGVKDDNPWAAHVTPEALPG